jgi:DNA polymerase eta
MVIAVSYSARPKGVKRIDSAESAREKCPEIVLAEVETRNNKPNLTRYRDASVDIFNVLSNAGATCERGSIDEAYLDVSDLVVRDEKENPDVSWPLDFTGLGVVVAGGDATNADATTNDTDNVDIVGHDEERRCNVRLWRGARIARRLRQRVLDELDYTVSCGVSFNKSLAKIGSGRNKPYNQTIVLPSSVMYLFRQLNVRKLPGLGG